MLSNKEAFYILCPQLSSVHHAHGKRRAAGRAHSARYVGCTNVMWFDLEMFRQFYRQYPITKSLISQFSLGLRRICLGWAEQPNLCLPLSVTSTNKGRIGSVSSEDAEEIRKMKCRAFVGCIYAPFFLVHGAHPTKTGRAEARNPVAF